jgi:hypothetical protein
LAIPRGRFAEQPSIAETILGSAADDLDALIAWATTHAQADKVAFSEVFTTEFFAASIRGIGPDYWR